MNFLQLCQQIINKFIEENGSGPKTADKAQQILDKFPDKYEERFESSRWFLIKTIIKHQIQFDLEVTGLERDGVDLVESGEARKRSEKAEEFLKNYKDLKIGIEQKPFAGYAGKKHYLLEEIINSLPKAERFAKVIDLLNRRVELNLDEETINAFILRDVLGDGERIDVGSKLQLLQLELPLEPYTIGRIISGIARELASNKDLTNEEKISIAEATIDAMKDKKELKRKDFIPFVGVIYDNTAEGEARIKKLKELATKLGPTLSPIGILKLIIDETPAERKLSVAKELKEQYGDFKSADQLTGYALDEALGYGGCLVRNKIKQSLEAKYPNKKGEIAELISSDEFLSEIKKFMSLLKKQGWSAEEEAKYIQNDFKDTSLFENFIELIKNCIKWILNKHLEEANRYMYDGKTEIKPFTERLEKELKPNIQL